MGGGGTWAIVGEISAGSLSFKDTFHVTLLACLHCLCLRLLVAVVPLRLCVEDSVVAVSEY